MTPVEYWSGIIAVVEIVSVTLFLHSLTAAAIRFFVAAGCLQFYCCTVFFVATLTNHLADIGPDALSYLKFFGLMWMVVPAISGYLLLRLTNDFYYDARAASRDLLGKRETAPEAFARGAIRA
ncbi:hypothetical protein A5653_16275 [Mycobacterium colombiense]|uniref:hypothetical protein n=1 Tax=Mycobacterium colombiense TaxID=339268 RepID=UPI0007EF98A5|nr:hypothetical protein [Mycobacterium colombiense]OBK67823.1 hypothetical protein A5653_16275 [Mycobacterium colombiense]